MKINKWRRMWIVIDNASARVNPLCWLDLLSGFRQHGALLKMEWEGGPVVYDVEATLRRYHIHPYGRSFHIDIETKANGDEEEVWTRWFWVNMAQAEWAEYLLMSAGVPLTGLLNGNNAKAFGKGRPVSWDERKGRRGLPRATLIEALADFIVGLTR